jgi:hypothetical protein
MEALGVVAGRHDQSRRRVGTDAEEVQQIGHGGDEEGVNPLVELCQLVVEGGDPTGQRGQRRLGGRGHRIGRTGRSELDPFGH